jgi:hypothetical protein
LSLLTLELFLSITFLAITIIYTRRLDVPAVKSSPLAILLAPSLELQAQLGNTRNLEIARRQADSLRVRLENGKLVLA